MEITEHGICLVEGLSVVDRKSFFGSFYVKWMFRHVAYRQTDKLACNCSKKCNFSLFIILLT